MPMGATSTSEPPSFLDFEVTTSTSVPVSADALALKSRSRFCLAAEAKEDLGLAAPTAPLTLPALRIHLLLRVRDTRDPKDLIACGHKRQTLFQEMVGP